MDSLLRLTALLLSAVLLLAGCGSGGHSAFVTSDSRNSAALTLNSNGLQTQYSSVIRADVPFAFYQLNESGTSALDTMQKGPDLLYARGIQKLAPGLLSSNADKAVVFTGSLDSKGVFANNLGRNMVFEPDRRLSVEAWIRPTSFGNTMDIVHYGGSSFGETPIRQGYKLYLSGSRVVFQVAPTVNYSAHYQLVTVSYPVTLLANQVYHIVGTYDGTTSNLYVTQSLSKAVSSPATARAAGAGRIEYGNVNAMAIGGNSIPTVNERFNGTIADVAIYKKALNSTQVRNHFRAGTGLPTDIDVSANVTAAAGGLLELPNGTSIGFDPKFLPRDRLVTVTLHEKEFPFTSFPAFKAVGPHLTVAFSPVNKSYPFAIKYRTRRSEKALRWFDNRPLIHIALKGCPRLGEYLDPHKSTIAIVYKSLSTPTVTKVITSPIDVFSGEADTALPDPLSYLPSNPTHALRNLEITLITKKSTALSP